MKQIELPIYSDVAAAAKRLEGVAHRTPVLTSRTADQVTGARVFFKCENFQRMGAFKFRGAYNSISQFSPGQRAAGVLAYSSGNHSQAIALSAKLLGVSSTIVMPRDAPKAKLEATKSYGAEVITYDRYAESREEIAGNLAQERGSTLIPPYDHPQVIAGQGTAAKELFEETGSLDFLFVCLGGGGLLAGSALSASELSPGTQIFGVEPEAGNDGQQSLRAGRIVSIPAPNTLADGAQTTHLGAYTFPIIQRYVKDVVTVSDQQLVKTMRFFAERMKMIVEPTGCLAAAAMLEGVASIRDARVGVIISGGNIDLKRFAELIG